MRYSLISQKYDTGIAYRIYDSVRGLTTFNERSISVCLSHLYENNFNVMSSCPSIHTLLNNPNISLIWEFNVAEEVIEKYPEEFI